MAGRPTADWDQLLLQSQDLVRSVRGEAAPRAWELSPQSQGSDGTRWQPPCSRGRALAPPAAASAGRRRHSNRRLLAWAAVPQEAAFPRVQRDILQVEQYSQKLRSRTARADATAETLEASRLLAHEGLNPRKLTQVGGSACCCHPSSCWVAEG